MINDKLKNNISDDNLKIKNKKKFLKKKHNISLNNDIYNINYIDKLKIKIKNLKKKLNLKKKKIVGYKDKILKFKNKILDLKLITKAEIDNIYKRNNKEIKKIRKYAIEDFAKDLLPIIDSLNDTIKIIKKDNIKNNIDIICEGIELTYRKFLFVIKKFGISVINKSYVVFDPNYHQAMFVIENLEEKKFNLVNKNIENNTVVSVLQDGYILNGRLLRPAMVEVFKKKTKKH